MSKPESMLEQNLNALKLTIVTLMPKRKERFDCKAQLNINVLIELYGTTTLPVSFDPLELENTITHLNGTNNKKLNNFHYN